MVPLSFPATGLSRARCGPSGPRSAGDGASAAPSAGEGPGVARAPAPTCGHPRAGVRKCWGCGEQRGSTIEAQIPPGAEPQEVAQNSRRTAGSRPLPSGASGERCRAAGPGSPGQGLFHRTAASCPGRAARAGTPSRSFWCTCEATCVPHLPRAREEEEADPVSPMTARPGPWCALRSPARSGGTRAWVPGKTAGSTVSRGNIFSPRLSDP